jgi:hypothetical protein
MHLTIHMYEREEIAAEPTQMWSNNRHCCTCGNGGISRVSAQSEHVGTRLSCCAIGAGNHAEA